MRVRSQGCEVRAQQPHSNAERCSCGGVEGALITNFGSKGVKRNQKKFNEDICYRKKNVIKQIWKNTYGEFQVKKTGENCGNIIGFGPSDFLRHDGPSDFLRHVGHSRPSHFGTLKHDNVEEKGKSEKFGDLEYVSDSTARIDVIQPSSVLYEF